MFVGHFAAGFAAKRAAPTVSLAWLVFCTQWADILWPALVLAGIEHAEIQPGITEANFLHLQHMPWSHSLAMLAVWAVVLALPWLWRRAYRDAAVVAACVLSHWVLDWVAHRPDVPLVPGSEAKVGLGLWNSLPGTLLIEGALWAVGVALYGRSTRPTSRWGQWGLWSLVAFLTVSWLGSVFGPPPPNIRVLTSVALVSAAVLLPWIRTVELRRTVRAPTPS